MKEPLAGGDEEGVLVLHPGDGRAAAHDHDHRLQERGVGRAHQNGRHVRIRLASLDGDDETRGPEQDEAQVRVDVKEGSPPAHQGRGRAVGGRAQQAYLGPNPGGEEDEDDADGAEGKEHDGANDALGPPHLGQGDVVGEGVDLGIVEGLGPATTLGGFVSITAHDVTRVYF